MTEKLQEGCTVQPQTKEELAEIIRQTCKKQGWDCDLNFIDTSKITDMSYLFSDHIIDGLGLSKFCGNISRWDTSNVTDMSYMFEGAKYFNGSLNNWDVSNVRSMSYMFSYATSFNQPLDNWNTSNVTDMTSMFFWADDFNQPINDWDVSNVTQMSNMFNGAQSFNQPINDWDVGNVTDMNKMFAGAYNFNQPLNNWDTSNVYNMEAMFCSSHSFNQPLNNWDISKVTNMEAMFLHAEHFCQDLSQWKINDNCFIDMMFDNTYALPDAYLPFDLQLDLKTNLINSDHLSSENNIFIEAPKNDPLLKNTKAIYLQTDRIWIFPINELNSNNTFVLDKTCYKTYDDVFSCSPMLKADICKLFIKNQKNEFTQEHQDKIQDKSEKRSFNR